MPINETCGIGYCFEGGVTFEAGLGISAKAEIGLSSKQLRATLGGGAIAQVELSVDGQQFQIWPIPLMQAVCLVIYMYNKWIICIFTSLFTFFAF